MIQLLFCSEKLETSALFPLGSDNIISLLIAIGLTNITLFNTQLSQLLTNQLVSILNINKIFKNIYCASLDQRPKTQGSSCKKRKGNFSEIKTATSHSFFSFLGYHQDGFAFPKKNIDCFILELERTYD